MFLEVCRGEVAEVSRNAQDKSRGKRKQKEMAAKTEKHVNVMMMTIRNEVEIGSGHGCVILVNEICNHSEMTGP